jgi:hypothetical protein
MHDGIAKEFPSWRRHAESLAAHLGRVERVTLSDIYRFNHAADLSDCEVNAFDLNALFKHQYTSVATSQWRNSARWDQMHGSLWHSGTIWATGLDYWVDRCVKQDPAEPVDHLTTQQSLENVVRRCSLSDIIEIREIPSVRAFREAFNNLQHRWTKVSDAPNSLMKHYEDARGDINAIVSDRDKIPKTSWSRAVVECAITLAGSTVVPLALKVAGEPIPAVLGLSTEAAVGCAILQFGLRAFGNVSQNAISRRAFFRNELYALRQYRDGSAACCWRD